MDDFTASGLHESKNEWSARLLTILTPHIVDGFRSILDEAVTVCNENEEMEKYLMTFQNFIGRIPKWSNEIVKNETARIIEKSGCQYLEDLITCVHVIHLKILTAVRVGQKPKKIDIDIMNINEFVHKVYINVARQVYKNVYLFDIQVAPLQKQKNHREIEIIAQECILNTVRDSIPVQNILRCYLDESTEDDITEEIKEEDITPAPEPVPEPVPTTTTTPAQVPGNDVDSLGAITISSEASGSVGEASGSVGNGNESEAISSSSSSSNLLTFNDVDTAVDTEMNEFSIDAPKNIPRLEEISRSRNEIRKQEEEDDGDGGSGGGGGGISISTQPISMDDMDVHSLDSSAIDLNPALMMNDVEVLI
jgi:hypothetical protein